MKSSYTSRRGGWPAEISKREISRVRLDELPFESFSDVQNGPTNRQPVEEEEGRELRPAPGVGVRNPRSAKHLKLMLGASGIPNGSAAVE